MIQHLDWSKNANIYEVNIRQYTKEGTINSFRKHLPRLKTMHVDIIWIMPIQPIGLFNRKGSLGSYYSISDYKEVSKEFGSLDDFKSMVNEAHKLGMYVLLDWVANHTSWDNIWTKSNPDFYQKNDTGAFVSPWDWTDVIALDYSNPEMRKQMIAAMEYWLVETDIDGFRCDMAGMVPTNFWNETVNHLNKIRKVFMLAEDETKIDLLNDAFDMNFTWEMHHLMNEIAKGEKQASDIWYKFLGQKEIYPENAYRMYFTSNHDENSHSGSTIERMGDGAKAFTILKYILPGMALTYSGEEAANPNRLLFFEKDSIDWSDIKFEDLYTQLNLLKKTNKSIWNGPFGGNFVDINYGQNDKVFACFREKDESKIVAVLNLTDHQQQFTINNINLSGKFKDVFSGEEVFPGQGYMFDLSPWEFILLEGID